MACYDDEAAGWLRGVLSFRYTLPVVSSEVGPVRSVPLPDSASPLSGGSPSRRLVPPARTIMLPNSGLLGWEGGRCASRQHTAERRTFYLLDAR